MTLSEVSIPGPVPRLEVPGWRERFGLAAGITWRGDGSPPGFDLGLWTRDPVEDVMGRWRDFRRAEFGVGTVVMAHQVHGAEVAWHADPSGWVIHDGLDGHATDRSGVLLCVTVADCTPVYLVAPRQGAFALLHAGWRGAAAGILERGVALLRGRTGAQPAEMVVHLGVAICGPCYEVGREVLEAFGLPAEGGGPWRLDVRAQLLRRAEGLGVGEVSTSGWCSAHHDDRFFSHRRGADGRMVAFLGRPAA